MPTLMNYLRHMDELELKIRVKNQSVVVAGIDTWNI